MHLNPPLAVTEIETKAVYNNAETKVVDITETKAVELIETKAVDINVETKVVELI